MAPQRPLVRKEYSEHIKAFGPASKKKTKYKHVDPWILATLWTNQTYATYLPKARILENYDYLFKEFVPCKSVQISWKLISARKNIVVIVIAIAVAVAVAVRVAVAVVVAVTVAVALPVAVAAAAGGVVVVVVVVVVVIIVVVVAAAVAAGVVVRGKPYTTRARFWSTSEVRL